MQLTLLMHLLISLVVMVAVVAGYHRWFLAPLLEKQRLAIQAAQERAGRQLQQSLDERLDGVMNSLSDNSLTGTTRQMLRFGSDLMEGGISTFLSGSPEGRASGRSDKEPTR